MATAFAAKPDTPFAAVGRRAPGPGRHARGHRNSRQGSDAGASVGDGDAGGESRDRRWENGPRYDAKASGSTQFLTRDPLAALTGSAYGYVADDPLNATDPTGLCLGPLAVLCAEAAAEGIGDLLAWIGATGAVATGAAVVITMPKNVSYPQPTALPGPSASINYAKDYTDEADDEYDTGCLEREARRADAQRRRDNRIFQELTKDLTPEQQQRLHRRISKKGYTTEEIQDEIDTLFGTRE